MVMWCDVIWCEIGIICTSVLMWIGTLYRLDVPRRCWSPSLTDAYCQAVYAFSLFLSSLYDSFLNWYHLTYAIWHVSMFWVTVSLIFIQSLLLHAILDISTFHTFFLAQNFAQTVYRLFNFLWFGCITSPWCNIHMRINHLVSSGFPCSFVILWLLLNMARRDSTGANQHHAITPDSKFGEALGALHEAYIAAMRGTTHLYHSF